MSIKGIVFSIVGALFGILALIWVPSAPGMRTSFHRICNDSSVSFVHSR